MKQKEAFLQKEGRKWLSRNLQRLDKGIDPVIEAISTYKIKPEEVLEVGCSNGWRLERLEEKYSCGTWGIDPGFYTHGIYKGTADNLQFWEDGKFDVVIYGWCLYLCDPEDYFRIAAEGDRVLKDKGFLIIYDFYNYKPYKTPYKHANGLFSYHYNFANLWRAHPAYHVYGNTNQDLTSVTILQKNMKTAFPVEK